MRTLSAVMLALLASMAHAERVEFKGVFAPTASVIADAEKPYREAICLNGKWQFQPVPVRSDFRPDVGQPPELTPPRDDAWDATPIKIPSHWNVNTWGNGRNVGAGTPFPYRPDSIYFPSYPTSWDGVQMAWMRRSVDVPNTFRDHRVLLRFEAVAGECRVLVNGKPVGDSHFDSYLPFEIDVTDAIKVGASNEILVGVRSPHLFDQRSERYPKMIAPYPTGSNMDGLAGIWQDVNLLAVPKVRASSVFVRPSVASATLDVDVTVQNDSDRAGDYQIAGDVTERRHGADPDRQLSSIEQAIGPAEGLSSGFALKLGAQHVRLEAHESKKITLHVNVRGELHPWSPASSILYAALVRVIDEHATPGNGQIDFTETPFGWREFTIRGRELLLNGQPIQLVGDLTHPFGAYIQSRRFAWAWFTMVKQMGGNAVRLHGQPFPHEYLDLADEMGIVVLDETALFGSSIRLNFDSPDAWRRFGEHVDALVQRDRNHPSVFGWSFGNELFAIFELNQVTQSDRDRWYGQLAGLADRVKALDPTRPWISCDGDEDLHGTLPTWSKHFGLGVPLDRLPPATFDKPLMVGESGGTYYARPSQLAPINGDRACESYVGRSEALGIDVYDNLTQMARPRLAYFSPSEIVWFGIEHLNLGYSDFSRLPTKDDGIFFTAPFVDGQPGMQIERIPPYVTTLNPGLDPSLPLFKPLPMFNAFKAAMHQPSALPDPISRAIKSTIMPTSRPAFIDRVAYFGGEELRRKLRLLGVPLGDGLGAKLLIVDAGSLNDANVEAVRHSIDAYRAAGGTAFICFDGDVKVSDALNAMLPAPIERTDRQATALVRREPIEWTATFTVPDLYFAEDPADRFVLKHGLAGPLVKRGRVLLEASNTDWSLFNDQPEAAKCAAVVLHEHLEKPGGAALLDVVDPKGHFIVSSIDMNLSSTARIRLWRQLMTGLGVKLIAPPSRWLSPIAIMSQAGVDWRYSFDRPADLSWTTPGFDDANWPVGKGGIGERVPNARPRTEWRGDDVWMRRVVTLNDKDVSDIAADGVKLVAHYDENVEIYVNGVAALKRDGFTTRYGTFDLSDAARQTLHAGPNLIAVHCSQIAGGKYIDVGLATGVVPDDQLTIDPAKHDLLLNGPKE